MNTSSLKGRTHKRRRFRWAANHDNGKVCQLIGIYEHEHAQSQPSHGEVCHLICIATEHAQLLTAQSWGGLSPHLHSNRACSVTAQSWGGLSPHLHSNRACSVTAQSWGGLSPHLHGSTCLLTAQSFSPKLCKYFSSTKCKQNIIIHFTIWTSSNQGFFMF